ncbi:MAG: phasin family protein [Hyphomicrobiaceae bacterium]
MDTQKSNGYSHLQTAPFDVETMIEMSAPATEVVKTFNSKLVENVGAYQKEWFGFFSQRWIENITLPLKIATCHSLPEVQQVYAAHWKRAAEQYGAEFSHAIEAAQQNKQMTSEPAIAPAGRQSASAPRTPTH